MILRILHWKDGDTSKFYKTRESFSLLPNDFEIDGTSCLFNRIDH